MIRPPQLLDDTRITPKILLTCNENNWKTMTEMHDLGNPLKENQRQDQATSYNGSADKEATVVRKQNIPSPERCQASRESQQRSR